MVPTAAAKFLKTLWEFRAKSLLTTIIVVSGISFVHLTKVVTYDFTPKPKGSVGLWSGRCPAMLLRMDVAALEVGGGLCFNTWKGKTTTAEHLSQALRVPIDMEGFWGDSDSETRGL